MKKIIMLLALAMIFTFILTAEEVVPELDDGYTAIFTPVTNFAIKDWTVNGKTKVGLKLGTVTFKFGNDYNDGNSNIRLTTTLPQISISGTAIWNGSQSWNGNNEVTVRVDGQWVTHNSGGMYTVYTGGLTGKTIVIELFFFIADYAVSQIAEGCYCTISDSISSSFSFVSSKYFTQSGEHGGEVALPMTDGSTNADGTTTLIPDKTIIEDKEYVYGQEPVADPTLYTRIEENTSYDLGSLTNVEIAKIKAYGTDLEDNTKVLVKIKHAETKSAFELTHDSSAEKIPYSLYTNISSDKVVNNQSFQPNVTVGKTNTSLATAVELLTLYARLDVTRSELAQKRTGSYSDTVYIEISLDK